MDIRKNNPELVEKLIEGRWTIENDEFEEKFNSLSFNDQCKVADAINDMEDEMMRNLGIDEDDEDFSLADFCRGGDLTED